MIVIWKKHKIITQPTEGKSRLHFDKIENEFIYTNNEIHYSNRMVASQHLYILSYEEIKEGDWVYSTHLYNAKPLFKVLKNMAILELQKGGFAGCLKVVATTDETLGLPLIPNDFVIQWANKPSEEVEAEYSNEFWKSSCDGEDVEIEELLIKDKSINCRFIQPKETWNDVIDRYQTETNKEDIALEDGLIEWLDQNYKVLKSS